MRRSIVSMTAENVIVKCVGMIRTAWRSSRVVSGGVNCVQWRNNRACKACSARGPSSVGGGQNLPDAVF